MSDSLIDDLLSDWDEDEDGVKDEDVEANRPAPPSAKSSAPIEPVDDEDDAIDDGEALDDSLLDTADEPGDVDLTSMAIDLNKDDNEVNRIHMPPYEDDEDDDVHDEIEEWPEDEDDDEDDFDEDEETSSSNAGIDDSDDDSEDEGSDDGNESEDEDDLDDSDDDWGESDEEDGDEDLDDEEEDVPVGSRSRPRHDDFENEDDTVSKPNRKSPYENDFDEDDNAEYDEDDSDEDEDASPEEEEDYEDDALPMPALDEELQGMSMADDDSMAMDDYPEPSRPARPRRRRPRPIPDDDSYEDEDEEDSNEEPIPIPTSGKGRARRPVSMNHKRLRRPKPLPEDMEESEPEEPDKDTPEGNNGGRGLLGKVPHVHMPKFRKPTASSIINAPFNLLRKIRKARRMYWIASMVAGLLIALWSALNIGAATNKGGPTTEAVNEGSVDVASASWDKGKDQAEVMLRNKSDMIAHMAGKADVRTWSPDYRPASWVSPRVVASCPIPQQDIDPGKTKTITISMKDCKGKVHGVWPRVKVQLDYQ